MTPKYANIWFYGGVNAELHAKNKAVNVTGSTKLSAEAAEKAGIKVPRLDSKGQEGVDYVVVQGLESPSRKGA